MKKTKKRLTRLLAICVCLIVVLSACASVDVPSDNSTSTEESKATSTLELSEVNAESTSSETEPLDESSESEPSTPEGHISADSDATLSGDITITPIEPTYPEERETTLELVREYPLGGEGGIPFYLQYDSEPANAAIITPYSFLVDENGNVYSFDGAFFYDLQNHTELELPISERTVGSVLVYGGKLYCMNVGGVLNIYTMQEGKIDTIKFPTIKEGKEYGIFFSPDGVPLATADGKFYNIDGKQISDVYYLSEEDDHSNKLLHFGREYTFENDLYISSCTNGILTVFEKQEYRIQQKLDEPPYWHVENFREDIIYQYDTKGDPLSEFLFYLHYTGQKVPISVFYKGEECKSYFTKTAIIGKQRFDNLIDANWFVGADGTIYLMLIDPEGGKLYKINPGYSDVEFTDFEVETEIQQTAARASTTVIHANVSADVAEKRADDMCNLIWQVQSEHRLVRAGAALPHHIAKDDYTLTQKGIPYCWGGYNGIDTVSYEGYRGIRFEDIITQDASDGQLYMTGNINSVIVSNTIGLDCSGYACSAYGFTSRTNTEGFLFNNAYGHEVVGELQSMDLIVKANTHCYLYDDKVEYPSGLIQYWVYDCTRGGNIDRTSRRLINVPSGYTYLRLCYTYDPDASSTYHTYSCSACGITDEEEPHTFGNYVSISASSHAKICTACGYQTNVQSHTFTYTPDLVGRHAKSCATCGYSATELHTYSTAYSYTTTQHWQTCTRCGTESTRTSHTLSFNYSTTQHWQACGTCGYTARAFAHTYNTYGVCTVCGYRRTAKTTEEPDLPTDDFIVLCVEPKEEFWESIQR